MKLPRERGATCMLEICDTTELLASSITVDSKMWGQKGYEINLRTCLAFVRSVMGIRVLSTSNGFKIIL